MRRLPARRKIGVLALVLFAVACAPALTYAAQLTGTDKVVGAGFSAVGSCGTMTNATVGWVVFTNTVTRVTVSGLPAACNGYSASVTLSGAADAKLTSQSRVVVASGTAVFSAMSGPTPAPAPSAVVKIHFLVVPASPVAWYSGSWDFRKAITVDYTKVAGTLTDFPLYVDVTDTGLRDQALDNGNDILFTSSNGTTKLDHDIEAFNGTTGALDAWVEIPSLSAVANSVIYMYYGNSFSPDQRATTATWDATHAAVWHMNEDPGGTAPQLQDGTSNNRDATTQGSMTSAQQVAGKLGGSIDFDSTNDRADATKFTPGTTAMTAQAWVRPERVNGGTDNRIIGRADSTTLNTSYNWSIGVVVGVPRVRLSTGSAVPTSHNATASISADVWSHVAYTYDGSNIRIYVNGAAAGTFAKTGTISSTAPSEEVVIGANDTLNGAMWEGALDEVRLSSTARSQQWLQTEFNNQNSPATFYSVGGAES